MILSNQVGIKQKLNIIKLNDKGRKILRKAEKSSTKKRFILKELIQE